MTANASSSSVSSRTEGIDLTAAGWLAPLPAAFLAGRDRDLLAPLRFLPGGELPSGPPPPGVRRELAQGLAVANRGYGHDRADDLARRLADPATRVVVTGQQPGLLGGPLYTFSKMVAAARWAAELEAQGEPAVAVFWVATEDHDWAEVSKATVLAPDGPRTFDLGPDPAPLMPVGMRALGPGITEVLAGLTAAVPGDRYAEWVATLSRWYRPDARFGEAFCRLMVYLLGPHCPLLLDAMHPALKEAQRPWLRRLVERRREVEEALERQDAEVERRGYALQVTPQRGVSPLFLLNRGERRRIEWREDGFGLRGRGGRSDGGGSIADLLRIIDDNPGVVSPGVLARPVIQDAVLGTTLQVLGPGEISYMAQVSAVYPVLEVDAPWTTLRPQAMVLESHQIEKLAEVGVTLPDLLAPGADNTRLDRILAERQGGDFVAPARQGVARALDELRAPALATDPSLERPLEKTREQILRALDLFAETARAGGARRDVVASRRVRLLRDTAMPQGKPQERVVASAHFQGKYGSRLIESFREQLELDPARLQVISP